MSNLKLTIDLLPKGAWGNNLRERLSKKDWCALRDICYEKANYRCTVCGRGGDLEAHEVWDFNIKTKTQTLKDIVALCPACHGVKHMRNSERIGYGEQSREHFLKVNGCNQLTFAKHYTEAQILFEERNSILRWKLNVNLDRFGGNGLEIKERDIPIIFDPYEGIDWNTVKHQRTTQNNSSQEENIYKETITLQSLNNPMYHVLYKPGMLPPRICSIVVDNYCGAITVICDRVNKIQWISGEEIIRTKYNFAGKFTTSFSVEDLKGSSIQFRLIGDGGQTVSQPFELIGE